MVETLFETPAAGAPVPVAGPASLLPLGGGHGSDGDRASMIVGEAVSEARSLPRELRFIVFGQPAAQGSKRHVGGGRMIESSKRTKPFRDSVISAARVEIDARPDWTPLDGCLYARVIATFYRPKSHFRTGRNAHLLRDGVPVQPNSAPDIDKIARLCLDALTQSGAIRDDARIVEFLRLAKVYACEDADALDVPGVRIEVREASR